jgi:hypothetical protein
MNEFDDRMDKAVEAVTVDAEGVVRATLTADDWQIYRDAPDREAVALALNASVERAYREGLDPDDTVEAVMETHRKSGAWDTEPRTVLALIRRAVEPRLAAGPGPR